MSAEHRMQARIPTESERLRRQITEQSNRFERERRALERSIEKQRRFNDQLNARIDVQRRNAEQQINQLQTSFQDSQRQLQVQYRQQQDAFNQKLIRQREQLNHQIDIQKRIFEDSLERNAQLEANKRAAMRAELEARIESEIEAERVNRQQMINNLRDYTDNHISEMRAEYRQIAADQQAQINSVKEDMASIFAARAQTLADARDTIQDLQMFYNGLLDDNGRVTVFDYERFRPNRLNTFHGRIDNAIRMLHAGNAGAALAHAQGIYDSLVDLELEVIQDKEKFDNEYALTILAYEYLNEAIRQNETMPIRGIENPDEYRLDEWSDGEYRRLADEIQEISERLENEYKILTPRDLENLQNQQQAYYDRLQEIIDKAIDRVISSQQRVELARNIAGILEGFHFDPNHAGYEQADKKRSYMFSSERQSDGTKITVTIIPNDDNFENTISINTDQPGLFRTVDADRRTEAIIRELRDNNINVGNRQNLPNHNVELMDCYQLTQRDSEGIPRRVLDAVVNRVQ